MTTTTTTASIIISSSIMIRIVIKNSIQQCDMRRNLIRFLSIYIRHEPMNGISCQSTSCRM